MSEQFKLYDCDVGLTIRGANYDFEHVDSVGIENGERTRLIRGANAKNKKGISYREGLKEAKTVTFTLNDLPMALQDLLQEVYDSQERIDGYVISRKDGSSKMIKNAVLSQQPMQLTLDDSPESMNVGIVLESFDVTEKKKS